MNVIVDTSIWINFFKGDSYPEVESALQEGRVFLTPVIASELISGVKTHAEEVKLLEWMSHLPCVETSFIHWIEAGRLRNKCQKKGFQVSTPDAHIAQAAIELAATLITRDKIFGKIKALLSIPVSILD